MSSYPPFLLVACTDRSPRIESMKMETIIRSPQKGVIAKLIHKEGVSSLLSVL